MAQSRWKAMGNRWELFQRQTEMCFKKHRVINKPNYSKFRRRADDTEEETKGCRGLQRSAPRCLPPPPEAQASGALWPPAATQLHSVAPEPQDERSAGGCPYRLWSGQEHTQQQEQNSIIAFPKDCERQTFKPSVEETQTQNHCKPDWVSLYLVPKKLSR